MPNLRMVMPYCLQGLSLKPDPVKNPFFPSINLNHNAAYMNLKLLRIALFAFFLLGFQRANAQCQFTLNMQDAFGDGWNGGLLLIKSGTTIDTVGMTNTVGNGHDSTVLVTITNGAPLTIIWLSGFFDSEVTFQLLNNDGTLVFKDSFPGVGVLYNGTGNCINCLKPSDLQAYNVYDTRAKIKWTPLSPNGAGWWVIYGPKGFVPGPGVGDTVYVTQPKTTLTGLAKKTWYDCYVVQDCGGGDHSLIVGPVSFETYFTNDVGITDVLSPVSGCNLGVETVKIVMKDFGAAPQSLIPFKYSVNGVDAGVSQPQDGFYTGVIGKDSSETIPFETQYDFSAPGEYLITVYTQMTGDEDTSNDTFNYRIVNRLVVPYTQPFETWNGGWHVDTASYQPSWAYGHPNKQVIKTAASGDKAWVTNLTGHYNVSEFSQLDSPCFDFTGTTADPVLEFSLNTDMNTNYDAAYVEMSTDGTTWQKVGAMGEGLNWYNTVSGNSTFGDIWSGSTGGWVTARHHLNGMAGKPEAHIRFVFSGGQFFAGGDGMGIDDVHVFVNENKDLAGTAISTLGDTSLCGLAKDTIRFTIANLGNINENPYKVAYSINGGAPITETVAHLLKPDLTYTYSFKHAFDSRDGKFTIKCWTALTGEQVPANDTVTYVVDHLPKQIPVIENFESGALPADWQASGGSVSNGHNNLSYVYGINMYFGVDTFTLNLPRYGLLGPNDSLRFDYRVTNWSTGLVPTILATGTDIRLQISTDCGATFQTVYTIDTLHHIPSATMRTIRVGLAQFAGQAIRLRFTGSWTKGDFWFDLDNINIRSCPADMELTAKTFPANPGTNNGKAIITVGLGNPPYKYTWSTGEVLSVPLITDLPAGPVTVTVTDALGCSSVLTLQITTPTTEIEGLTSFKLQPNPTMGRLMLNAEFDRPVEASMQILNLLGQEIWDRSLLRGNNLLEEVDLTQYPAGLYLVRLTVDGQTVTRKIIKSNN
jgi:hypothetical protein